MRKTKIICTIGPATEDIQVLRQLICAGMNIARLNFSHGSYAEHASRIHNIRQAAEEENTIIGILLDTKGPEIRTGSLGSPATLRTGADFVLTTEDIVGNEEIVSVSYEGLPNEVNKGAVLLIDDGLIGLRVKRTAGTKIYCTVEHGGVLDSRKGVNIPGIEINLPSLTEKDIQDILFGIEHNVDFIAASFIRKPQDVLEIREILEEHSAKAKIISKIENREGIRHAESILSISDGIMVARGDMGVEIDVEEVPLVQKELIRKANLLGKPVITATQMLDSMQRNPRPTRAEASDVANAIFDGTDAVMLSGETAIGKYAVGSVHTMSQIVMRTEGALEYKQMLELRVKEIGKSITDSISQAVVSTSHNLECSAIITATESGHAAQMISKYRPMVPVIAVTPNESVLRSLTLVWGVYPMLCTSVSTTDEMFQVAVTTARLSGLVTDGDLVIISAGVPVGRSGTTNLMKVHVLSGMLASGQGIGSKIVSGKVVAGRTIGELRSKMIDGAILVTTSTDKEIMDLLKRASAIITEEGGLTSHAAIVGISLDIPVVVGVQGAISSFQKEDVVTVDSKRGVIYPGRTNVL